MRDRVAIRCGFVTFTVERKDPEEMYQVLTRQQIHVPVTPSSSTLLDIEARRLGSMIRASMHYYNSEEEVERFCAAAASDRR